MPKLRIEDLKSIKDQMQKTVMAREGSSCRVRVVVHMGTCGISAGARDVMKALLGELERTALTDVIATTSGCAGLCSREPMVTVEASGEAPVKYVDVTPDRIKRIFDEHVIKGRIVAEYALVMGSERTL